MVYRNVQPGGGIEWRCRKPYLRVLMGDQRLDLKVVVKRDVQHEAESRRAVEVYRMASDNLEEISTKTIAAEGHQLEALSRDR